MTPTILEILPERTTPRGHRRPAEYLLRINFPGFGTGHPVTIASGSSEKAMVYVTEDGLDAAVALLRSIGYDPKPVPLP